MKASELSIGDWVKVLNYHWDGSPYIGQVDGIMKKHGTYYLLFGDALNAEIDVCEPIPLTPEILEKNGIRYQWGELWWQREGDIYEVVHNDKSRLRLRYVHELQHALRLVGVEKEIEL